MSIPSQFPPVLLAMRPQAVAALALTSGQELAVRVLGPGPNGSTLVLAGNQQLNLKFPVPPPPGTVLTMRVEGSGAEAKLVLVKAEPPLVVQQRPVLPATGQPAQAGATPTLNAGQAAQITVLPTPTAGQGIATSSMPAASTVSPATLPEAARGAGARPLVVVSTNPEVISAIRITPGQTMPVTVIGPSPEGMATMVQAGSRQVPLQLPNPPVPGAVIQVRLEGQGPAARLVLAQPTTAGGTPTAPQTTPANAPAPAAPLSAPAATPRAALAQMLPMALERQGSVATLMRTLAVVAPMVAKMPDPVKRTIAQLTSNSLRLDGRIDGAALRQAVQRSGIFREALLAAGQRPAGPEVKSDVLNLTRVVRNWLGGELAPVPPVRGAPPPMRGAIPRAPPRDGPLPQPQNVEEAGKILHERAEAAASRIRLLQHASLPDETARAVVKPAEWNLEIPVVLQGQPNVMPLQIHADEGSEGEKGERGWRVRFAIDLGENGEVGAQVGLRGSRASAMLWAAEPETARQLETLLPELGEALSAIGLVPGTLVCRTGAPEQPSRPSGGILDARR